MPISYPAGLPMPEDKNYILPPPQAFKDILENINQYTFEELLNILDTWDKHVDKYYIDIVRSRVQNLKRDNQTSINKEVNNHEITKPKQKSNAPKPRHSRKTKDIAESDSGNLLDGNGEGVLTTST